jgi:hypothetical protein
MIWGRRVVHPRSTAWRPAVRGVNGGCANWHWGRGRVAGGGQWRAGGPVVACTWRAVCGGCCRRLMRKQTPVCDCIISTRHRCRIISALSPTHPPTCYHPLPAGRAANGSRTTRTTAACWRTPLWRGTATVAASRRLPTRSGGAPPTRCGWAGRERGARRRRGRGDPVSSFELHLPSQSSCTHASKNGLCCRHVLTYTE